MDDNVLQFPKNKIVRENVIDIEVIEKYKEKGIQNFADKVIDDMVANILGDLENYGIEIDTEQFSKDFSLASDSLRATVYRSFGIEHSLHEFVDNNIEIVPKEVDK